MTQRRLNDDENSVPTFEIDLDTDARTRYDHVLLQPESHDRGRLQLHGEERYGALPFPYMRRLLAIRDELLEGEFRVVRKLQWLTPLARRVCRSMYHDELAGIARTVNAELTRVRHDGAGLTLDELYLLQAAYEASALCTSIVFQPPSDRDAARDARGPVHIRSMDWEMPFLQSITMTFVYKRHGAVMYFGTTWLGFVGLFTGMRPGQFSLSLNFRPLEVSVWGLVRKLVRVRRTRLMASLLRETLETAPTYDGALEAVSAAVAFSPCYVIIAGARRGQGAIVTKGTILDHHLEVQELLDADCNYLVQVNIDAPNHLPPAQRPRGCPEQGDVFQSKWRHRFATRELQRLGWRLMEEAAEGAATEDDVDMSCASADMARRRVHGPLWALMRRRPIRDEITIYVTLMVPWSGQYEAVLP